METKEIRAQLKSKLGYNARQVSIKHDSYSMGSSTYFTVRDASVDLKKVKDFAKSFEHIHRCERTGEILSGGNSFFDVMVTDEVKEAWAAEHIESVTIAAALIKNGVESATITGGWALLSDGHHTSFRLVRFNDNGCGDMLGSYYNCKDSLIAVAVRIAQS